MEVVEFVRMKIVRPFDSQVPTNLWLDIGDVRFTIRVKVEPKR